MPMRFKRQWDFNPGNKALALNDLTQDRDVMEALQEALAIARTGEAADIPFNGTPSSLLATNVQAAVDEAITELRNLEDQIAGIIGDAGLNAEGVMDLLGHTGLVAGDNVTLTYDDTAGTLTLGVTIPDTGLDVEAVRDTIGTTLVAGTGISVAVDDAGDHITIAASSGGGLFRGEWTADSLLYSNSLGTLAGLGAGWASSGSVSFPTSGGPPGFTPYMKVGTAPGASTTPGDETLTTSAVSALAGFALTRAVFWGQTTRFSGSTAPTFKVNGSTVNTQAYPGSGSTSSWVEYTAAINAVNPTLNFHAVDMEFHAAGLRIYGTANPYLAGQYVSYAGQLWRSTIDNNGSVPGADGLWVAVPLGAKVISVPTANYTLALADAGTFIRMNVASANTLTVPPNSSVAFPVGTVIEGSQAGAGQVTITPGAGVTINATPGLKTAAQYATFGLLKTATDTWLAYGRLSA